MITPFPSCTCEMFQSQTAEINRLHTENAALLVRIADLTAAHAERAEAELDKWREAHYLVCKQAERADAECVALREALNLFYDESCDCEMCHRARIALATSPATVLPLDVQTECASDSAKDSAGS